ncbi:hypothetical protein AFERRI_530071 [Acidithiobacillus ferrivorans]|uniref:Uncharacterized protein n=1 Tax=Acidithiobacillus ferrivorans TaxID=160808 RepID=A0A060US84_9PROT|nr:hypothetical protein AFERRI_530071 [Acidithiobacillus ferrivorans]
MNDGDAGGCNEHIEGIGGCDRGDSFGGVRNGYAGEWAVSAHYTASGADGGKTESWCAGVEY